LLHIIKIWFFSACPLRSQVSGSGARTEGSAIGAVLGGLAGAGIADKTIDCDPVYTTSSTGYPAASTSQYGASSYGSAQPSAPSYGQTYGTTTYSQARLAIRRLAAISNMRAARHITRQAITRLRLQRNMSLRHLRL